MQQAWPGSNGAKPGSIGAAPIAGPGFRCAASGYVLTRRDEVRRVQYVTGHAAQGNGHDGKLPADIDWASIADPAATTVVYMPTRTLPELVARAHQAGLDPQTPAIAVERATRADERVIATTIAELPYRLAAEPPSGPVVVLIGRVFAEHVAATNAETVGRAERSEAHAG